MSQAKPIGELKTLVSLVDRTDFDEAVYPAGESDTRFQPIVKHYTNYIQETVIWPFSGRPDWGQRVTFSVPWPWEADFLHWIALRLKPMSWLNSILCAQIQLGIYVPLSPETMWVWASSLGSAAIQLVEMEVDGVILEQFSGDWLTTWNLAYHTVTDGVAWDDAVYGVSTPLTYKHHEPSEDGYVYCYLPFWFSKFSNTAFPLLSCSGPNRVRFHITMRPFAEVVRMVATPKACGATPLGTSFQYRDYSFPFRQFGTATIGSAVPAFSAADMICGISQLDRPYRDPYLANPHELLMNPVVETAFAEPLKYVVNTPMGGAVTIKLPLTAANGPLKQILYFLRRKDAPELYAEWDNFGAVLGPDVDPVFNPQRPLLQRAQLMIGTAVWADQDEDWWRSQAMAMMPGGVRGSGNYVYGFNFAELPTAFSPSGSVNASRVDLWLTLTVAPPEDVEWSVTVFTISQNFMRFQNGLANQLFMD
jgi:hypothetical protein